MKTKALFLFGTLAALLFGWLTICAVCDPKEPSYDGHTLSQWMVLYYNTYHPETAPPNFAQKKEQVEKSETAVKAIGTNAIPTALRWLSGSYDVRDYFHISAFNEGYPLDGMAETILAILGEDAQPAVSALIQIAESNKSAKTRIVALRLLEKIEKNRTVIIPVFIRCAKGDKDAKVREYALGDVVELVGLDRKTGEELTSALLNDPDQKVRHEAKLFNEQLDFFFPDSSDDAIETNNIQNK